MVKREVASELGTFLSSRTSICGRGHQRRNLDFHFYHHHHHQQLLGARHCDLARLVGRAGGRMDRREERDPQFGTIFPPQRHQARCLRRRRRRCPFPFQLPRNTPLPSLSVYLSMDKRFPLDQEQEDKRGALEGRGPRFPNPACLSLCPPSRGRVTVMMRRRRRQCQTGKAWETTDDGRSRKIVYEDRLPFSPRARWAPTSCSVTCINYAPARGADLTPRRTALHLFRPDEFADRSLSLSNGRQSKPLSRPAGETSDFTAGA